MITLNNIVKHYNKNIVLNDISLKIEPGQSIAFTGHNGCGKSTLLKITAGLVRPTSGYVTYQKALLFHYVPEHFPKMNLTARKYLLHMGQMDGLSRGESEKKIQALSEEFFFEQMLDIPMKHLSKGSLQKVGVVQALLKQPEVLLLDEPLSGQDVTSQQVFIQKINDLRKKGVIVLMSCHEPYLVDAISDRVYHFENGKLKQDEKGIRKRQEWYTLVFQKQKAAAVPEKWKGHLQFTEDGCRMKVLEHESDTAILEMLKTGWSLRGMWNEDNM